MKRFIALWNESFDGRSHNIMILRSLVTIIIITFIDPLRQTSIGQVIIKQKKENSKRLN